MMATACILLASVLASTPYSRVRATTDPSAHCLWWPSSTITWQQNTMGNPTTGPKAFDAISTAFATWQLAMQQCGSLTLQEGERSSARQTGYDPTGANTNLVLFRVSNCKKKVPSTAACWAEGTCGSDFDCWDHASNVLGVTTVTFDTTTGRIFDADIELNAASYYFTTATNPVCPTLPNQSCTANDVQNTVTHEIGHLMGLGHVTSTTSTMSATAGWGETTKRVLDSGTKSFVCQVYTAGLAPKDCRIDATTDVLGTEAEVAQGCASISAGPGYLALLGLAGLLARSRRRAAALLTVLLFAPSAEAASVVALDVAGLTQASDAVVHARVERVEARWTRDHSHIVTDVHLTVLEQLKGEACSTVIITQPGGVVGRIGQRVEGLAAFSAGEEVVVFLEARGPRFSVAGLSQGKFRLERSAAGVPVARQAMTDVLLIDPVTFRPVDAAPLVIDLDALRAQVAEVARREPPRGGVNP